MRFTRGGLTAAWRTTLYERMTRRIFPLAGWLVWALDVGTNFRIHIVSGAAAILVIAPAAGAASAFLVIPALVLAHNLIRVVQAESLGLRATTPREGDGPTIEFVALNMLWRNRAYDPVLSFIRASGADVIVLQEMTDGALAALDALGDVYPFRHGAGGHNHVAILSKHPLHDVAFHDFQEDRNRLISARLDWDGRMITLIGLHLRAPLSPRYLATRDRQIDQFIAHTRDVEEPLIALGDFNTTRYTGAFRRTTSGTGLRPLGSGIVQPRASWPSWLGGLGLQIDHILVGPEFGLRRSKIGRAVGSDHRPVTATLFLTEPPSR